RRHTVGRNLRLKAQTECPALQARFPEIAFPYYYARRFLRDAHDRLRPPEQPPAQSSLYYKARASVLIPRSQTHELRHSQFSIRRARRFWKMYARQSGSSASRDIRGRLDNPRIVHIRNKLHRLPQRRFLERLRETFRAVRD